VSPKNAFGISG